MLLRLRHYLQVYKGYLSTSLSEDMSFRTSFTLMTLMDLFFYFSTFATISILYDHIESIGPWNREQLMFFISYCLCLNHLHMTLMSHNFWDLPEKIKTGRLDFLLVKPVASLFEVFFRRIRTSAFINAPIIWGATIYYGIQVNLSALSWILLPVLIVLSMSLMAIIEFIIASSMFWIHEGMGINFLRMQMQQLARWPYFVYADLPRKFFMVVIPILLVGSAPTHFLYDYNQWQMMAMLVIGIIFFGTILKVVWKIALRHYESASS